MDPFDGATMQTYRSRTIVAAVLALGAVLSARAEAQTTILFLDSQPGDYIGGGVQHTVMPATGSFTASRNFDNGVSISVNTSGGVWSLAFAAPGDATLTPGTYDHATRWPFQSPTSPGLSVSGMGRGCNTLTGNFVVREALYGATGQVLAFAADFEQHCEGGGAALLGSIRVNSPVPFTPPAPAPTDGTTAIVMNSETGDYIGQGLQQMFTPAEGTFVAARNFDNGITISFNGGSVTWYLAVAAPGDALLVPGSYENATRWPFQSPTGAGLDVSGSGRGCNQVTGRFDVLEAVYGPGGQVLRFAADFEQHCEGMEPALFGAVRYHSTIAAPPVQLPPARCGSRVTSMADLQAEVDGLAATTQTKQELSNTLQHAQAALDGGEAAGARRWIGTFIHQVVNRSNLPTTNQHRIEFAPANHLTCGAANVLLNVAATQ
jgi:hypothetical protein